MQHFPASADLLFISPCECNSLNGFLGFQLYFKRIVQILTEIFENASSDREIEMSWVALASVETHFIHLFHSFEAKQIAQIIPRDSQNILHSRNTFWLLIYDLHISNLWYCIVFVKYSDFNWIPIKTE